MSLFSAKYKLDDNDKKINKIFERIILVFVFMQILSPLVASFFSLIGLNLGMLNVLIISTICFFLVEIIYFSFNIVFINWKKPTVFQIVGLSLLLWLLVIALINNSFNYAFLFWIGYFLSFLMFFQVDKKHYKTLLYTFIFTLTVCSIMGLLDPFNSYMPGFVSNAYPMALQFMNPNNAAYATVLAISLCIYALLNFKKIWEQIVLWSCLVVLNFALFVNGCFSAEFALFVMLLFLVVFFWVKNKKTPWVILISLGVSISSSFACLIYTNIWQASTAADIFLFEAISAFDNIFKTGVLGFVTGGEKTFVAGSDGWNRMAQLKDGINACVDSPKSFLFGYGTEKNYDLLIHNVYLQSWLEGGIITLGLYIAVIVLFVINFIKNIKSDNGIVLMSVFLMLVLVVHNLGCLEPFSFTYFAMFFGVLAKGVKLFGKNSEQKDLNLQVKNLKGDENGKTK